MSSQKLTITITTIYTTNIKENLVTSLWTRRIVHIIKHKLPYQHWPLPLLPLVITCLKGEEKTYREQLFHKSFGYHHLKRRNFCRLR